MASFFGRNKKQQSSVEHPGDIESSADIPVKTDEVSAFDRLVDFPVEFFVPNEAELFEDVHGHKRSNPLEISEQLLREPIESVKISVYSKLGRFSILSTIKFHDDDEAKATEAKIKSELRKESKRNGGETDERGGMFIYENTEGNPTIVSLSQRPYVKDELLVSTGTVNAGYSNYLDVLERRELSPEVFKRSLAEVLGMTSLALCIAYENSKKTPAEQKIEIGVQKDDYLPILGIDPQGDEKQSVENIKEELSSEERRVSFDDIGGQESAKAELKRIVTGITKPEIYKKWGTEPPKGVLLYGPPGTGKTMLAKALASEAEASFYNVSSADVSSMWYGQSEKKIRSIFEKAAKDEKAIIYFDEIDALTPERAGAHEATSRVIGVILQQMDGIGKNDGITVVGSTNRRESIDQALLRPGRFDSHVAVEKPDFASRREIFSIHISKSEQIANRQLFATDIDINKITEVADDLTGADIREIVRRTLAAKVTLDLERSADDPEVDLVSQEEIESEILKYNQSRSDSRD